MMVLPFRRTVFLLIIGWLVLAGCESAPESSEPAAAVEVRLAEARARLGATEAGRLIQDAVAAHGGLQRWWTNGPVYFRFAYRPLGDRRPIDTYQLIDTWSSRARHWLEADTSVGFGWDGATAWRTPPGADLPTNARFWSLTPYYFIGVPFVLADPGVLLAMDGTMDFEGTTYDLVRVTFAPGTGDAPDDYYLVLVHPETRRVGGVRYVVSYPGYYPDGGHSPEKLMAYDGVQTIDGIVFPETFRTFTWADGRPGDLVTETSMTDVVFRPATPDSAFAVPAGAEVLPGY